MNDKDECECGDYRRDHYRGGGLCERCGPGDGMNGGLWCREFRLMKPYREGVVLSFEPQVPSPLKLWFTPPWSVSFGYAVLGTWLLTVAMIVLAVVFS